MKMTWLYHGRGIEITRKNRMKSIWLAFVCLGMEMAIGAETTAILRCQHEITKAITYTTDYCPVGTTAVSRPEQGGFVSGGNNMTRGLITVCRMDSRFDSFRYIQDGDCPFGSTRMANYANATIEEARLQFFATWRPAAQEPKSPKSSSMASRRTTTKQATADCHFLRQQRDRVQTRLNNNKAYQDDLQRLRDAQEAIAKEGCRSFGD